MISSPFTDRFWRGNGVQIALFCVLLAALAAGIVYGATAMPYRWQWARVPPYLFKTLDGALYLGPLLKGLLVTMRISAWASLAMLAIGLVAALLLLSKSFAGRWVARCYVETIRNTPLLVQIYLVYFVLAPIIGLGREAAGILALALFEGAFAAEIIRAGILAVPRDQAEGALSLGLRPWQVQAFVLLPQAARITLPPLTGLGISLVKHSAIVSAIAIFDLASEGRNAIADTFMTFEIWLTVAAIYLVVTTTLSLLAGRLERRLARATR